jgi:hypothetical protein
VRGSGTEVAAARSAGFLPIGGQYAADQAGTSECGYLQASAGHGRRNEPIVDSRSARGDPLWQ